MNVAEQPQDNQTPASGDVGGDDDLATLAGGLSTDEPTSDPQEDEPEEETPEVEASDEDSTDDEVPEDDEPAGAEQQALSDDTDVDLDGESVKLSDLKSVYKTFKGEKSLSKMRGAYLRAREEITTERKQFEAERAPLHQAKQQLDDLRFAYESDPVAYGRHAFKMGAQDGLVDQGMVEAIEAVIEEYAQNGTYNPHQLAARAAQAQAQRQTQSVQYEQRKQQFERQIWSLQEREQRIFSPEERTKLVNAWNVLAVEQGTRPSLEDAWKFVQANTPPPPPKKPVAKPSPAKVAQQLRKPKKATTERPGGSSRQSGYTKADLDRDLEFIARM